MDTIESTVRAYFRAFQASDSSTLANLFTDDGVIAPLGMSTINGQAAIKEAFDRFFDAVGMSCDELTVDRVKKIGDVAIVETHTIERVTNRATSTTETASYRELFCLLQHDGDWRIASYMFNQ